MLFLFLTACPSATSDDPFFGASGRYDAPKWGDTGDDGDTGDTGDTGGSTEGGDGAPVFTDIVGAWKEDPNGMALAVSATFTDKDDDLDGGMCYIDATFGEESENFDGSVGGDPAADICTISGDSFVFALPGLDASLETTVKFQVKDSSQNVSKEETVVVPGE